MFRKEIKPLSESMIDAIGNTINKLEYVEEKVNVKGIQKAIDDGKSMDEIMTMFANKRTTNTDEIRKVAKEYMWKKRKMKEEVEGLEEADANSIGQALMKKHGEGSKVVKKSGRYYIKYTKGNSEANIGPFNDLDDVMKHLKEEVELEEKINKDYFHTSVESGKFMKSKLGGAGNADTMFLHDLDNKGSDGKSPMLVTFAKQADAEKAAKQHGGKIVKSGMGTFRIIKEEVELEEKMDPVGKADADIDNDGDVDSSDKYLHARRKAIGKAMKKRKMNEQDTKMGTITVNSDEERKKRAAAYRAKKMKSEEVELDEAKSATGYTIYHKTFSSAVQHAISQVEKQGYTVDEEEWDRKVAMGPKKPSAGKTNSYTIPLLKNGKPTPRKLQMQVYYDEGRYELNMYIS